MFRNVPECSVFRVLSTAVVGLGRDGTLHGTNESPSCTFPLGRPVSRKAGKLIK